MKTLKEKLEETTKKHKKEVANNLRDRAIHIGNLKNIRPGDKIRVYNSCFYHTAIYAKVHMVDKENDAIYVHLHHVIMRFHMFNCRKWGLDREKPTEKGTTIKKNRLLSSSNFIDLIKYPIINVEYKEKISISENFLCYDEEESQVCPHLNWVVTGSYRCHHMNVYLFSLNSKACKVKKEVD